MFGKQNAFFNNVIYNLYDTVDTISIEILNEKYNHDFILRLEFFLYSTVFSHF